MSARDQLRQLDMLEDKANEIKTFQMPATAAIVQGRGARKRLAETLVSLQATRALLVTGKSIGNGTFFGDVVRELSAAGVKVATHIGVIAHNPVDSVLDLVWQAREFRPQVIVAIGGGTPIDASKLVAIALAADAGDRETFLDYSVQFEYPDSERVKDVSGSFVPLVAVPTTLSAAEWDGFASCVDVSDSRKIVFRNRMMTPRVVILDPELAALTPRDLWITSGVRAIDHAVESVCSIGAHPYSTSLALGALELFGKYLSESAGGMQRDDAILNCQIAAGMSIAGVHTVSLGLSHALGHQLGAFGIPHGVTSCLTLPHVMRFLEPVTRAAQDRIARALSPQFDGRQSAADLVEELFTKLAVPRRIRDYGLQQRDLEDIVEHALKDVVIRACPIELSRKDLRGVLQQAW